MNCEAVIKSLGFSCRQLGRDTLRVWSPFHYVGDGERIGFYVEKINSGFRVTDNCEAMMHATETGLSMTPARLNSVRKATGFAECFKEGGEIESYVTEADIGKGMASVLNAALAISHLRPQWTTRLRADSFVKDVEAVLDAALSDRVLKKQAVKGASTHQIEFPFAVKDGLDLIYVQPIAASEENGVDWRHVYEGWGRMTDLKNAGIENAQRLVVLQDAANDDETKNAVAILSGTSSVVLYSRLRHWAEHKQA